MMSKILVCSFETFQEVNDTVEALYDNGYSRHDLGVIMSVDTRGKRIPDKHEVKQLVQNGSKNAAIQALIALSESIGTLTFDGKKILATGPCARKISGENGNSGLVGSLVELGQRFSHAKLSEQELEDGNILLSIQTSSDKAHITKSLLKNSGAQAIFLG